MLILLALAATALSGVPGLFLPPASRAGERIATGTAVLGAALGAAAALLGLATGDGGGAACRWAVIGGEFAVGVDGLSAFFLLPLFVVAPLGQVYALAYWSASARPETARRLRFYYGTLTCGIALLLTARNLPTFLVGWEVMAISAFLAITIEDTERPVRDAGHLYLISTHVATLCLFGLFALLHDTTGSYDWTAPARGVAAGARGTAIFLLALAGFGLKAGMMPLHVWLPSAHANAPSHVSALMSGVLIKTGIYCLFRVLLLFPDPPAWWGGTVLALGVASGVLGVAFAIGQHDLKRLLAYHSIENIGIILMGLGLGLLARAHGRPGAALLGFAGSLFHVWNHGLFKALLFLGAGSVIHATHTRSIDHLGGLAKRMPRTAGWFLLGAVAICGLPPLNGFASEFLVYLGLMRAVANAPLPLWLAAAFTAPALALVGALAVACFVKVCGAVFLGEPRTAAAGGAHESGRAMTGPLAALGVLCVALGAAPWAAAPALDAALAATPGRAGLAAGLGATPGVAEHAPLGLLTLAALLLAATTAAAAALLRSRLRAAPFSTAVTWDCGYAAPAPSMQYTSSSFAQMLVDLFSWALRPRTHAPQIGGPFPRPSVFHAHVPDTVLDGWLTPAAAAWGRFCDACKRLQQGSVHAYLLYILVTVIVLLAWRR